MKQQDAPKPNVIISKKRNPTHVRAISESLEGIMMAACLQPLDVIKVRLQLDRACNYRGMIHCASTISQTEGVRALWKGFTPHAAHLSVKYAFRTGSNVAMLSLLNDYKSGKFTSIWPLVSAHGASVLIETFVIGTPLEVVKTRLQQQRGVNPVNLKYKGALQCAGMIIRKEGFRGLWAGAAPTLVRNVVQNSANITAFSALMNLLLRKKREGNLRKALNPLSFIILGSLAFVTGPVVSNPFDVVKTRLMAQPESGEVKYKGMMHAMRTIYAEEGLLAFWRGTLPRVMWIPPAMIIASTVSYRVNRLYETSPNINVHWKH